MNDSITHITEQVTENILGNIFSTKKLNSILEVCSDDIVFFCPESGISTTSRKELVRLNNSSINPLEIENFSIESYSFETKSDRNLFEVLTTVKLSSSVNNIPYTLQAMVVFWTCQDSDIKVINISMSKPRKELKPVSDKDTHLLNLISSSLLYLKNDDALTIKRANNAFYTTFNVEAKAAAEGQQLSSFLNYADENEGKKIKELAARLKVNTPSKPVKLKLKDTYGQARYVIANLILTKHKNGNEFFYCIMTDITEQTNEYIKLKSRLRRFVALAEISDCIHIEYDIEEDTLYFIKSSNMQAADSKITDFSNKAAKSNLFSNKDIGEFNKIKESLISNPEGELFEFETELNLSKKGLYGSA